MNVKFRTYGYGTGVVVLVVFIRQKQMLTFPKKMIVLGQKLKTLKI